MKDTFSIEIKRLTQENIDDVIEIEKKLMGNIIGQKILL